MPTPRQIELDAAFTKACARTRWTADPDKVCLKIAEQKGATPKEVYDAVRAVLETPQ